MRRNKAGRPRKRTIRRWLRRHPHALGWWENSASSSAAFLCNGDDHVWRTAYRNERADLVHQVCGVCRSRRTGRWTRTKGRLRFKVVR